MDLISVTVEASQPTIKQFSLGYKERIRRWKGNDAIPPRLVDFLAEFKTEILTLKLTIESCKLLIPLCISVLNSVSPLYENSHLVKGVAKSLGGEDRKISFPVNQHELSRWWNSYT